MKYLVRVQGRKAPAFIMPISEKHSQRQQNKYLTIHERRIMTTTIIGICIEDRLENAVKFQKIITEFGCNIKTRIGLHSSMQNVCLNRGIALLEVSGEAIALQEELAKHWIIQTMSFE